MKATAAGTLIGPGADAIAIRNLSAFPIRVKQMDTIAEAPFHLVDDVDKSSGNNDFQMAINGSAVKQTAELPDDGSWAMGYKGNNDGTDVLPLTISSAKIARVTEDLSSAKKAATVTWTVEPTTTIKPEPKPDPKNGIAFAIYSDDDNSLNLYKRDRKPEIGDTFNGKAVTQVIDIDETRPDSCGHAQFPPTASIFANVTWDTKTIEVVDSGIKPSSTDNWFAACNATVADVVRLDTSADCSMSGMFYGCSKLTSLDLSSLDTSVTCSMGEIFCGCSNLTSLDLSGWNTSKVTDMYEMFAGCSSLATMDILSGWNTSNVIDMSRMFNDCSNLTSLDLSGWDISNVGPLTSMGGMGGMFCGCSNLTRLDLSGWDTSGVMVMNEMFMNCPNLALDCSNWNVSPDTYHDDFSTNSPGVIAPNWIN